MSFELKGKKIWVAGHLGMVGSAISRRLQTENVTLITATRAQLDLTDQSAVAAFLDRERPEIIVDAAAKVGGIIANSTYPADFMMQNLSIINNIMRAARNLQVPRLLFLGSSCIYPRLAPQPLSESALLTGPLEPTNEAYAIAKITGIKTVEAVRKQDKLSWIAMMPTNLYGPGDNYHPENSHVLPALIRRAHEAKIANAQELVIWGSGNPRREFLHVDDLADAAVFVLKNYDNDQFINAGYGTDMTIRELAEMVCRVVGYPGQLVFDTSKPDGMPQKLLDSSRLLALGWQPQIKLEKGIHHAYLWFQENIESVRR